MLKADFEVMLWAGLQQAILDAGKGFRGLGGFELGVKPRKCAFSAGCGRLLQNIAEGQKAALIFHGRTLSDSLSLSHRQSQRGAALPACQQFGNNPPLRYCHWPYQNVRVEAVLSCRLVLNVVLREQIPD